MEHDEHHDHKEHSHEEHSHEGHSHKEHEEHSHEHHTHEEPNYMKLAFSATAHCLLGCGIGEVIGIVIGTALLFSTINTIILAVLLGFVFGFALGMYPLLKAKFSLRHAIKQVLIAEGLSILVMESAEVLVEVYTPGVMMAGLDEPIFWAGMLLALTMGFIAAFPVNYVMAKQGIRHHH